MSKTYSQAWQREFAENLDMELMEIQHEFELKFKARMDALKSDIMADMAQFKRRLEIAAKCFAKEESA